MKTLKFQRSAPVASIAWIVFFLLVILGVGQNIYCQIFHAYSLYDDEGTLLISFQAMQQGHRLYDEFQGIYGIFHHYFYYALFEILGWTVNHSNLRWLVAGQWLLSCILLSLAMGLLLKSRTIALLTLILCSIRLQRLQAEPGLTQSVVIFVTALFVLTLVIGARRYYPAWLGVLSAIMFHIKINLGLYFFVASCLALKPSCNRILRAWCLGCGLLVPTGILMFLGSPAQTFPLCLLITSSLICAYILDVKPLTGERRFKEVLPFLLVFTGVWIGFLILARLSGISWSSMFYGIFLQHLGVSKALCESLDMRSHHFFIAIFPIASCLEFTVKSPIPF